MSEEHKNVLFALSTCNACKKTKALLDREGIDYLYVEVDTVDKDSRGELIEKIRQYNPRETLPTLVLNGGKKVVVGYGEEEILDALKETGLGRSPH